MQIWNFGDTLTQRKFKAGALSAFLPGLYAGMVPTILGPNQLSLSPGSLLSPGGVFFYSNVATVVPDFPVLSAPDEYTLVATHDDIQAIGGSNFRLSWVQGIQPRFDAPTNAVAVLYVRQDVPGALATDQFSQPPYVMNGLVLDRFEDHLLLLGPAFTTFAVVNGANVSLSNAVAAMGAQYLGLKVTNTALVGLQTSSFKLAIPERVRLHGVEVFCELPVLGSIAINGIASDGSTVALTGSPIVGPIVDVTLSNALDFALTALEIVALDVVVTVPGTQQAFLHKVRLLTD